MIISRKFQFTDNELWHWPEGDTLLLESMATLSDAQKIIEWVPPSKRRVAIQAGGACGLWAAVFARYFSTVVTFEPVTENYTCLRLNLARLGLFQAELHEIADGQSPQIITVPAALSAEKGVDCVWMVPGNAGAGYIEPVPGNADSPCIHEPGGLCSLMPLDDLPPRGAVGLIQLDVEGHELLALAGATKTIERDLPVIALEEKAHPHSNASPTAAGDWLCKVHNYKMVEKYHNDVVYLPC